MPHNFDQRETEHYSKKKIEQIEKDSCSFSCLCFLFAILEKRKEGYSYLQFYIFVSVRVVTMSHCQFTGSAFQRNLTSHFRLTIQTQSLEWTITYDIFSRFFKWIETEDDLDSRRFCSECSLVFSPITKKTLILRKTDLCQINTAPTGSADSLAISFVQERRSIFSPRNPSVKFLPSLSDCYSAS